MSETSPGYGGTPPAPTQRPSIGRIVLYKHAGSADGKYPPMVSPAIITQVHSDTCVNLCVLSAGDGLFFPHSITQGDGPSQWSWPPRV